MATTDRDKARDLLRGWQAARQVQNRDGSSVVAALAYAMLDLGDALRETGKRGVSGPDSQYPGRTHPAPAGAPARPSQPDRTHPAPPKAANPERRCPVTDDLSASAL